MTHIIPLTKIGFFNPGRLSDEEIEQSFIARVPFFEFILKKVVAEHPDSIPQHHLIIGQRGMGKSSLLSRIAAELRKPPYKDAFIPLSFPEEQYNIDRLSKFWLNCLDALADALDKESENIFLASLDAEISSLSKVKSLDANEVYETFEKWIRKIKRRPVLLVDNLNLIFSKIDRKEQHQLRAILMSKGAPVLVGASSTAIDETVDYQAPFYDAFQINYLKKLTFSESIDVLVNLTKITGKIYFEDKIYLQKGRLEALYQLTGGTPRTLAILFPLIQNGFSENIQTDLDALLDVITPLYKARFEEELSPQLQVVMDAVALHWDPINLEQLREVTMLENGQLSPQLKRLIDVGWLQKLDAYEAKGGAYELSERFFNVWYLMRRSSRRQKKELYCLTKFLESFYGSDLHDIANARIHYKSENTNQIALDLALADAVKEKELSEKLRSKSYEALINLSLNNKGILKNFTVPTYITEKKVKDLMIEADAQLKANKYYDAESTIQKLIRIDDKSAYHWNGLGDLYHLYLGRYQEAEDAYKKAIELDEKFASPWYGLGNLYQDYLGKYQETEQAYKKAIELDEKFAHSWNGLGNLYTSRLGRYQEAEDAYKKAIALDEKFAYFWVSLGNLYMNRLGRYQEAEQAYKKAIQLDEKFAYFWISLGDLYRDYLGRYQEAEQAYKKAIQLDEKFVYSWNDLGNLYMNRLGRYQEAEDAYKKAIELDGEFVYSWNDLGNLYHLYLGRYQEAEQAYKKAIQLDEKFASSWNGLGHLYHLYLGRYQEAEDAYKKAIELDEKFANPWYGLGNLYQDYLGKYQETEQAYKKAIELDEKFAHSWNGLGNLYTNRLGRYQEAEQAYKKAIEQNDKSAYSWNGLGDLYQKYLGKYPEAEQAYKKAIELDDKSAYSWYSLGSLYMNHSDRYQEAEQIFKKAIQLDSKNDCYYNTLGNLYQDFLRNYNEAEMAYMKALEFDPNSVCAKYNLVFLWRDKMNRIKEAKELFNSIVKSDEFKDSYSLNYTIFAYYEKNIGIAEDSLKEALSSVGDSLPSSTVDDWYRSAAVIIKLNFASSILKVFTDTYYDIKFRPFYIAIEAISKNKNELFLNSIAVEVREPAKKIMEIIKNYMN